MEQEYVIHSETILKDEEKIHESLTKCKTCFKTVPKTMLCLYCGSPILYRHPKRE
jgi:rRNA maturation endonuclease Nob1